MGWGGEGRGGEGRGRGRGGEGVIMGGREENMPVISAIGTDLASITLVIKKLKGENFSRASAIGGCGLGVV